MNKNKLTPLLLGITLIVGGSAWIALNLLDVNIDFAVVWPLFLIIPGIAFWVSYFFNRKDWGVLIPANILLFLGLTFLLNSTVSNYLEYESIWTWTTFMYTGAPAIAFWIAWYASKKEIGMLIPAVILTLISFGTFCISLSVLLFSDLRLLEAGQVFWPLLFVCGGMFLLLMPFWQLVWRVDGAEEKKKDKKRKMTQKNTKEKQDKPQNAEEAEVIEG